MARVVDNGGGKSAVLTPAQIKAQVATATAQAKANANPRSLSTLQAIQNALSAQEASLNQTATTVAAQNAAMATAAVELKDAQIQSSKDAKDAAEAAANTRKILADVPVLIADPNANAPGYHLDITTGRWVKNIVTVTDTPPPFVFNPITKQWVQPPTEKLLAKDIFRSTLGIFFGPTEMDKPWATELYNAVSKFYKQGVSSDEAFNMAVLDSEKNPALTDFTKRFKGIYALQKMKQAGKAVTVPTIAEYFATESKMGDILRQSSLGELANEDFLGDVLSKGVSATEFANRITMIFDRIDRAPKEMKDTILRYFPSVDRISLAKALATGDTGAKELQNQVAGYEVLSAAEKQGLAAGQLAGGTTVEGAYQYALGGETYETALTKFGTVAAMREPVNKLTQIYKEEPLGQAGIEEAVFKKSAKQIKRLEDLAKKEEASYLGRSGVSQISLASQRRGSGSF